MYVPTLELFGFRYTLIPVASMYLYYDFTKIIPERAMSQFF